jgi:dephospho-CoA kinase
MPGVGQPIAVTGGIGAGKTAVLQVLAELGARTADADDLVHQLYEPGQPGHRAARERWGERILDPDGRVNRPALAEIVFADPNELSWLNGVIHPMVKERIAELASVGPGNLYCGIPLLFEAGWASRMKATISVWCDPETQHRRLRNRGWNDQEIARRLACQMTMDEKLERGDIGIINSGSWDHLREQCRLARERLET